MAYFQWSDSFSVGINRIDEQHKKLIDMLSQLHEAHMAQKGRDMQRKIVDAMVEYTKVHFETEERLMQKFNYADYNVHKMEHKKFTDKAVELKERIDEAGFVFTLEILEFLKSWLQDHILGTDIKYSALFKENGLM